MNGKYFIKGLIFFITWTIVSLSKLTGFYLIVWLFCPKVPETDKNPKPVYLWSPYMHETSNGWPKVYWLGWIMAEKGMSGCGPETCETWITYDVTTFRNVTF